MVKINIKWEKQVYQVDVDASKPVIELKNEIHKLTGVSPARQKIIGFKGGILKDDITWSQVDLVEGKTVMMMGSKDEVAKPPETAVKFIEDLPPDEQHNIANDLPNGLANLGNTCYLNSTLQTLRAVPELVQSIQTYKPPASQQSMYSSLVKSSQVLFNDLLKSGLPISTILFLTSFRKAFPQFAEERGGHYLQQDAEEALSQLLHAYGQELKAPTTATNESDTDGLNPNEQSLKKSIIGKLFGIEAIDTYTCNDNPEEQPTTHKELLLKLPCNINNEISYLHEGLKLSLEDVITKNSPSLNRQATYKKKTQLTVLPPYLFVQFVRFHWKKDVKESRDSATMGVKAKIIKPVQFPFNLDIFDLCNQELKDKLSVKRKIIEDNYNAQLERKRKPADDEEMTDKPAEKKPNNNQPSEQPLDLLSIQPNDTGKYELSAVLTHQGRYADSGHYVAWVKKSPNQWFKFDDNVVSLHTDEDIKKLIGGGDWHMAYICLYKSVSVEDASSN